MTIDIHAHLGESIYGISLGPQDLIKEMDKHSVDRAVVSPFTPLDLNIESANDFVASASKEYRKRLIGFGRIDPRNEQNAARELKRIKESDMRGIFLDPFEQGFLVLSPSVKSLLNACSDSDLVVLVRAGFPAISMAAQISWLAQQFPNTKIIMTHSGLMDASGLGVFDAVNAVAKIPNVFGETSGVYEVGEHGFMRRVIEVAGKTKILFGSNLPYSNYSIEIKRVEIAMRDQSEREAIFSENAAKILGLN